MANAKERENMYIKFLNTNKLYEGSVSVNGNVATLKFVEENVPVNTNGFRCYKDKEMQYNLSGDSYVAFNTLYRNDEETAKYNGYQLSNDGSIWVKPYAKVIFNASVGGHLDGNTTQEVYTYEELNIPEPIADTDYEFRHWSPEVPTSGDVEGNKTFTAIFVSTLPEPDPEPTVEERLTAVEEQNAMLSMTVDSILTDVIPSLM